MQSELWNQGNIGEGQTLKDPEFWFNVLWARVSWLQMRIEASAAQPCLNVTSKYYRGIRI